VLQKTMFELMGGEAKLDGLLDEFFRRVQADPDLGPLYPDDISPIKAAYKDFAMEMLGGPKRWTQRHSDFRMHEAHRHIPITEDRANAMIRCAKDAMNQFRIPKFVQEAARQRLESVIYDLVNTPAATFADPPAEKGDPPQPWA
jgi:hemoglobin